MGLLEIENCGKRLFEKYPSIKRSCKRVYQLVSYATSRKKIIYEGCPINCVSPDDGYEYFFGYYDKSPWDFDDRYLIALKVKKSYLSVAPNEPGLLVLIDILNNEFKEIGITYSWNVQQGCNAQWLGPDFKSRIIYNVFREGKYCSVIFNIEKMVEEKILPLPVYDVAKDASFALSLDFSRLHRLRPGYGYSNLPDDTAKELCPNTACIWKMSLDTGAIHDLFKYTDMAAFSYDERMEGAEHKVNHLMINPDGKRFMVLHRWFANGRKYTRLLTIDSDGTGVYNLSDDVFVSHCYWKNNDEILAFLRKKNLGDHYYLMRDKTQNYNLYWPELRTDGHCSYSPNGKYIITDTYPDRSRLASLFLCTEEEGHQGRTKRIGRVFSPFRYDNDCRCDLHPRWNHKGDRICIDSVHEGKRGLYVLDVPCDELMQVKKPEVVSIVVVLMATYNGEKYLEDQIQSLVNQKNVRLELLIRDDSSSDGTQALLEKLKNKYKFSWYSGEHVYVPKGYYDLMRKGYEKDRPYYSFCDQDDVWDDDKLSIAVAELEKFPSDIPALYYCGQRLVDSDLNYLADHRMNAERSLSTRFVISDIAGCTAVFNRALLEKIMMYEPKYMLMHDSWIFKLCLSLGGNVVVDEDCHISYRQHGNNTAGIGIGTKGRLKQFWKYVFKFKIQLQVQDLRDGYGEYMVPEYKMISDAICNYKTDKDSYRLLLDKKRIDFKNKLLNLTYNVKIFLRML